LVNLFSGDVQWTHFWKGFGALAGAYLFAALASRGLAQNEGQHLNPPPGTSQDVKTGDRATHSTQGFRVPTELE
jgi:hypothetical protein